MVTTQSRTSITRFDMMAGLLVRGQIRRTLQAACDDLTNRGYFCQLREYKAWLDSIFVVRVQTSQADRIKEIMTRLERILGENDT